MKTERIDEKMSDTKPSYKKTILLPKTDFPMRANLAHTEPQMIETWTQNKIYEKILEKNKERKNFTLTDGPPYANGHLHMGHALNKILKDIVIKYKNISGHCAPYIPGWDCHGLPIELDVTKKLGSKHKNMNDTQIRDLCRDNANKWVNTQKEQFIRYGVFGDWQNPYLTMQSEYEAEEVRTLARILKTGALYRGKKPVYWCLPLQTALAEAEVEYKEHKSPSIYVKFFLDEKSCQQLGLKHGSALIIWTTTPWTLPANLALAVHKDFKYGAFQVGEETFIFAKDLKTHFEEQTGVDLGDPQKIIKGHELESLNAKHPFIDRDSLIVIGSHVTLDAGTGVVHTAPGHGQDDYHVALKYNLPIFSPVGPDGKYTNEYKDLEGTNVFEANAVIIEKIKKSGHLIKDIEVIHSYPHCWRTKTPLIFRATSQWFIKMDHESYNIREKTLKAIKNIKWIPSWGEKRITAMIENRPDWCLSRQRIWGVPIPVLFCNKCHEALVDKEIMLKIADVIDKKGGIEAFHSHPITDLVGTKTCSCGSDQFTKSKDILDVWFDSGVCFATVQRKREGMKQPADLYLEGSDQHRGWFHTSLLASIASEDQAPYKTVLTHGFVMWSKGQKMSKSLGNTVSPEDIIKKNGAEILRLWAAHEDYSQDLTCEPEAFQRVTETYRRLRNTMRFLLGNLHDFDVTKNLIPYNEMEDLDKYALSQLSSLTKKCHSYYENYEFYKVYHALNQFFTVFLSSFYLDILKDRLYTWKENGKPRRSAQSTLHHLLWTLCPIMSPILSFLSEEVYSHLKGNKKESIFLEDYPTTPSQWENEKLNTQFEELLKIRSDVSKSLEELRIKKVIGSSLEAEVEISAEEQQFSLLNLYKKNLFHFFIVSKVTLREGKYRIQSIKSHGVKCERCWNFYEKDKGSDEFPLACPKCVEALT